MLWLPRKVRRGDEGCGDPMMGGRGGGRGHRGSRQVQNQLHQSHSGSESNLHVIIT